MVWILFLALSLTTICRGSTFMNPDNINRQAKALLGYNLDIELINYDHKLDQITITCHGYGANKSIGHTVAQRLNVPVITFNFPDHDIDEQFDVHASSFGTINEYLPLLYVLKTCVEHGFSKINLYGYSAGGGAIINALAILNNPAYASTLKTHGFDAHMISRAKQALSSGLIIMDTPLKSVTEILSIRPDEEVIQILAKRFTNNGFEAIHVIDQLKGLVLNVLVYFEQPDEILSNRDDALYIEKLKSVNTAGKVHLVIGNEDGHFGPHEKLWLAAKDLK